VAHHTSQRVDTQGVDVTYCEWRSESTLLVAGYRGSQTVVGIFDRLTLTYRDLWVGSDIATVGPVAAVSGINEAVDCVLVGEGFRRTSEIGVIRDGTYAAVKSFSLGYVELLDTIDVEYVAWKAPDGLEIQGWLLRPTTHHPGPVVMSIHGGPVCTHGRSGLVRRHAALLMLLSRGYLIVFPNDRGSTGRGQGFVRPILGDMGGKDRRLSFVAGLPC
jgi:dipeptidyl aminopeptidase/acylaminoacyl peptidase